MKCDTCPHDGENCQYCADESAKKGMIPWETVMEIINDNCVGFCSSMIIKKLKEHVQ